MTTKPQLKTIVTTLLIVSVLLAIVYTFPRFLVNTLGEASPWSSYLYLYGFGSIVFLIGIIIILKTGACRLGRGHDTFWFMVLIVGFFFFLTLHGTWILAALKMPFLGDQ